MVKHLLKLGALALVVLVAGVSLKSCSTEKAIDKTQLEGYWVLKSFEGKPVEESFKGNIPTLEFDFEKELVAGSAGCNRYFGNFILEGNTFKAQKLGSTMMACLEDNKEGEFLQLISSEGGLQISLEGNMLTFKTGENTHLEFAKEAKEDIAE